MDNGHLPLLAVTLGDPAGIGPEVVLKALAHEELHVRCRPLVLGDRRILERAGAWPGMPALAIEAVDDVNRADFGPGRLTLLDLHNADPAECPVGKVSPLAGRAAVAYVQQACDLCMARMAAAMVTAPLNKDAMNQAGFAYAGHTELLTERTGAQKVTMLLTAPSLRVVHVSTHVALAEAVRRVTRDRVAEVIDLAYQGCRALGVDTPRIGIAGLNPHAGEHGLFGDQETREIMPAVAAARARGLDVSDPQPPDTVFLRATQGTYDIVVAMYHDQGLAPMKMLSFDSGVNLTLGLPIVRTSPDHGTAFNLAGQNKANPGSMRAAIDWAATLAARPNPWA